MDNEEELEETDFEKFKDDEELDPLDIPEDLDGDLFDNSYKMSDEEE